MCNLYNHDFWDFIVENVFKNKIPDILEPYLDGNNLYILSGINRDFLLYKEKCDVRDIDFVVDSKIEISDSLLKKYQGKINSFGGVKLNVRGISIDLWSLEKTWGIVEQQKEPSIDSLLGSVFFNCTAIVYDVSNRCFIKTKDFDSFMEKKILDIVYENNPNIPLCIVNTFLYCEKYNLKISNHLKEWLIEMDKNVEDYENLEYKHYKKIVYSNEVIKKYIKDIK